MPEVNVLHLTSNWNADLSLEARSYPIRFRSATRVSSNPPPASILEVEVVSANARSSASDRQTAGLRPATEPVPPLPHRAFETNSTNRTGISSSLPGVTGAASNSPSQAWLHSQQEAALASLMDRYHRQLDVYA